MLSISSIVLTSVWNEVKHISILSGYKTLDYGKNIYLLKLIFHQRLQPEMNSYLNYIYVFPIKFSSKWCIANKISRLKNFFGKKLSSQIKIAGFDQF